jgi:DNA-binding MarR family transcriptional regulator
MAPGSRPSSRLAPEGAFPLNVGQVYTTLARLERDGLVVGDGGPDDEGRIPYRLTDAGRAEVSTWWERPVDRSEPARDELVMKLALAVATPRVDPYAVIQRQRTAAMSPLAGLTRAKLALSAPGWPHLSQPPHRPGIDPDEPVRRGRPRTPPVCRRGGAALAGPRRGAARASAWTGARCSSIGRPSTSRSPATRPCLPRPASPHFARPAPSDTTH